MINSNEEGLLEQDGALIVVTLEGRDFYGNIHIEAPTSDHITFGHIIGIDLPSVDALTGEDMLEMIAMTVIEQSVGEATFNEYKLSFCIL